MSTSTIAYKILTAAEFLSLKSGTFQGAPIDITDGYIHLSTAAQVTETVNKHFAGQSDLVIAAVNLTGLPIRWETSRNNDLFPHLYGALTLEHIISYEPLSRTEKGDVNLPA